MRSSLNLDILATYEDQLRSDTTWSIEWRPTGLASNTSERYPTIEELSPSASGVRGDPLDNAATVMVTVVRLLAGKHHQDAS